MKSIFRAVATITIFSMITRVLGFFFRIFLSRKLGAEGLGLFQIASSMLSIFMTLVASGLPLTTAKMVSKYNAKNDTKSVQNVVTTSVIISILVSVSCSIIILCLYPLLKLCFSDSRAVTILYSLIPSILFSAIYAVFRGAIWGNGDYFSCGLTELIEQAIRFVLTLILVNSADVFLASIESAVAFDLTCLISALVVMFIYLKHNKLSKNKAMYKPIIRSAAPITGVRLSSSLIQPLTSLILPSMLILSGYTKTEAISSFGIMMGMSFPMLFTPMTIVGSISMVLIPSISSLSAMGKDDIICNKIKNSIEISLFLSMIFVPLFFAVGDKIGIVLYANLQAGEMMQLSCMCMVPIALCNLSGSILNAINLENKSFLNYLWGSILLLVSLVVFTPIVKIYSISIGFFLSMLVSTTLNIRIIKRQYKSLELNIVSILTKYTIIVIPASLIGHFISNILGFLSVFMSGLLGGISSIVVFLVLVHTFKVFDIKAMIKLVRLSKQSKRKVIETNV